MSALDLSPGWSALAPREWMRETDPATAYLRQAGSRFRWVVVRQGETIQSGESFDFARAMQNADRSLDVAGVDLAPQQGWTSNGPVSRRVYRDGLPRIRASVTRVDAGIYRYEIRSGGSIVDSGYKAHVGKARAICDALGHRCVAAANDHRVAA